MNLPILEARLPLLRDPTGFVSYLDPDWSPDGRYLAYLLTNSAGASPAICVQEFQVSTDIAEAVTPVGAPIVVVPGSATVALRRPDWSPDGTTLAYESTATGLSYDIYTIQVFPTVGAPVRRTFEDHQAEQAPSFSPDGTQIAYQTSIYGPAVLAIVDLTTPSPHAWRLAEPIPALVSHFQPDWSSDGRSLYYHAPRNEDERRLPDIWKLDLENAAKCEISIDETAQSDVDVSRYLHSSPDGIPFNYFVYTSMSGATAGFQVPAIWRAQRIWSCIPPLPMGVQVSPSTIQLGSSGQTVTATLSFPAETKAAGYQCTSFDGPDEGVRMRITVLPSPVIEGVVTPRPDPATGGVFPVFVDKRVGGQPVIEVTWNRSDVVAYLLDRGLLGKNAPLQFTAYSNGVGRAFRGFAYVKLTSPTGTSAGTVSAGTVSAGTVSAGTVALQQNMPNPFNPTTAVRFTTGEAGRITVRIFNARGQLVRVLADEWFAQGRHSVLWDGRDDRGQDAPSGIYYALASAPSGNADRVKMVLMR